MVGRLADMPTNVSFKQSAYAATGRTESTGRGRCFHHSYPAISENKNWYEHTWVLFPDEMRKVITRSPMTCLIKRAPWGKQTHIFSVL